MNATAADGKGCSLSGRGRMFMATTSPILVQMARKAALTKQKSSHEADTLPEAGSLQGQSEHSPGHRSTAVSTGEHAVLLLGVDHGGGNWHRGGGVDNGAGSVGEWKLVSFDFTYSISQCWKHT